MNTHTTPSTQHQAQSTMHTPFRALPFQTVYAQYAWAKDDALSGYYALIPTRGSLRDKKLIRVRRDSLRRVLTLAIDDLAHRLNRTRHSDARHALERRIERLRRVNPDKINLPNRFLVRYTTTIRIGYKDIAHRNAAMRLDRIEHHTRWVYLTDYIRYGFVRALALGECPLDDSESYAAEGNEYADAGECDDAAEGVEEVR